MIIPHSLRVPFISLLLLLPALTLPAEELSQEIFIKTLQENWNLFKKIELNPTGTPTPFDLEIGESTLNLEDDGIYGGFRFTAPENASSLDFTWYFNIPNHWSTWYLIPSDEPFKPSFEWWQNADKVYEEVDAERGEDRFRAYQVLNAGYFTPGKEYIMWFQKLDEGESRITGRIQFVSPKEEWNHKEFEKALELTALPAEAQVDALRSRGGLILLDTQFFDRGYAKNRIDDVFDDMRATKKTRDGFLITMEQISPLCSTTPALSAIVEAYGEPDFIQTSTERDLLFSPTDGEASDESPTTTYYYDYFGLEVDSNDPEQKVQRIASQAFDYSQLNPKTDDPAFRQLSGKNLTVFYDEGTEVGRLYFFLEMGKDVLPIQLPPEGTYRDANESLVYLGNANWKLTQFYEDGTVAQDFQLSDNQFNGESNTYFPDGSPRYKVHLKNGVLHGKVIQYSQSGDIEFEGIFEDGEPVLTEDE